MSDGPEVASLRGAPSAPISVIVPAHGPVPFLAMAIAPLVQQIGAGDELLIVDNGIHTHVDLDGVTADPRVRLVDGRARPGAGIARNVGVAAAQHDRLLFCDADDVADDGYVAAMRAGLEHHQVVGAAESFHRLNNGPAAEQPDIGPVWFWKDDPAWPFVGSCALGMTRTAFDAVGGFDAAIPALEDVDLGCRLALAGVSTHGVEGVVMHIRHRGDARLEHRRQITHGRASVWLEARYAGHGLPTENRLRNALGWMRHGVGLLSRTAREDHYIALGWKRGRLAGSRDVRAGGGSVPLDLAPDHIPQADRG